MKINAKYLILFLVVSCIASCSHEAIKPRLLSNGEIVLIDSSRQAEQRIPYDSIWRFGHYPVYYFGPKKDTIRLGVNRIDGNERKSMSNPRRYLTQNLPSNLIIEVDTSFSLTLTVPYYHYKEKSFDPILDSTNYFECYAIFVYNLSDSIIQVGMFGELGHTIRQAKDSRGQWVDIESHMRYGCGTGARKLNLGKNDMIVALLPRYAGDLKTECRLKFSNWLGTVYSNSFEDYIFQKQLTDSIVDPY